MDGVTIGEGSIIGTGSIVTKDTPPYSISIGSPAKIIKYRFTKDQIAELLKLNVWNWEIKKIKENASNFTHIDKLLKVL